MGPVGLAPQVGIRREEERGSMGKKWKGREESRDRKGETRPKGEAGGEEVCAMTSSSSFQIFVNSLLTL